MHMVALQMTCLPFSYYAENTLTLYRIIDHLYPLSYLSVDMCLTGVTADCT